MENIKTDDKMRLELLQWQVEHQIKLMRGTLELNRGREEAAFEDAEHLEYGTEWRLKLQEAYAHQTKADYIETTIKELEAILKYNREVE